METSLRVCNRSVSSRLNSLLLSKIEGRVLAFRESSSLVPFRTLSVKADPNAIKPHSFRTNSYPLRNIDSDSALRAVAGNQTISREISDSNPNEDTWQVKMLYDGECPLCMIEVNTLRDRNESYGTIKFVDISSPDYSPEDNAGVEFETAMGKIHGILRDGKVVTGIEAFQKFYDVLGMGWVYSITKVKPIGKLADAVYDFWAKHRLPITGRPPLAIVLEERKKKREEALSCDLNGRCQVEE